eukprot:scaffold770_cov76-Amphora_coffeaeformis.AAC.2
MSPINSVAVAKAASLTAILFYRNKAKRKIGSRKGSPTRRRTRKTTEELFEQLGEVYFRRAFRMSYASYLALLAYLKDGILRVSGKDLESKKFRPNGTIYPTVRLGCALRYFAGGSPYDISCCFGISHTEVLDSVSCVIDATNDRFPLTYPSAHVEQLAIADDFRRHSQVGFAVCAGAIDGILIWIGKPSPRDCEEMKCDSGKFFCGRKHKFGLNCQVVSDRRGRILDLSIVYPGSTSDCLAFEGSKLYKSLQKTDFLHRGLCLFGDNAYLNSPYMATPYTGSVAGEIDAYNYYHSQLRIRVECTFGMLTERWAILRSAIPRNLSVHKTIGLVCTLARLHNFCIDQVEEAQINLPKYLADDTLRAKELGAVPLVLDDEHAEHSFQRVPVQLIGGGHHFDDYSRKLRRQYSKQFEDDVLPRERLCQIIGDGGYSRPPKNLDR